MAARRKAKKPDYIYAVGRRKSASARVRLFKGKGEDVVNGVPIAKYFTGLINKDLWSKPYKVADVGDNYFVTVRVVGGGKRGQLDAVVHGISRALATVNDGEYRVSLKKAGLLTRDARVRQRRMVGTGGKARRKKQSPKR